MIRNLSSFILLDVLHIKNPPKKSSRGKRFAPRCKSPESGLLGDRQELRRSLIYRSVYISKDPERQKQLAARVREVEQQIKSIRELKRFKG